MKWRLAGCLTWSYKEREGTCNSLGYHPLHSGTVALNSTFMITLGPSFTHKTNIFFVVFDLVPFYFYFFDLIFIVFLSITIMLVQWEPHKVHQSVIMLSLWHQMILLSFLDITSKCNCKLLMPDDWIISLNCIFISVFFHVNNFSFILSA